MNNIWRHFGARPELGVGEVETCEFWPNKTLSFLRIECLLCRRIWWKDPGIAIPRWGRCLQSDRVQSGRALDWHGMPLSPSSTIGYSRERHQIDKMSHWSNWYSKQPYNSGHFESFTPSNTYFREANFRLTPSFIWQTWTNPPSEVILHICCHNIKW